MEEKLDGLFTLLRAGAQPTPNTSPRPGNTDLFTLLKSGANPTPRASSTAANTDIFPELPESVDHDPQRSFFPPPNRSNVSSQPAGYPTPSDTSSDLYPSLAEAEEQLNFFTTQMLGFFPFIIMPAYSNACQFHREHPFLWLCIMAVATRSTKQQAYLGRVRSGSLLLVPALALMLVITLALSLDLTALFLLSL